MIEATSKLRADLLCCQRRMVQLSTAHVTKETAKTLDEQLASKTGVLWDCISYANWNDFGWLIWTGSPPDASYAVEHPELHDLILFALHQGIEYLMLDCDADIIDGLPQWEW